VQRDDRVLPAHGGTDDMSSAHKKIMLRKVKNTDMTLNEALQESTKVVAEFKKYNEILSSVGGCIFAYSGGFGWCLHGWRSQKGFSTPEEAYLDCCREIERGAE